MAKNLRPCNFIVTKGGEALSSVEATAKALSEIDNTILPKLSKLAKMGDIYWHGTLDKKLEYSTKGTFVSKEKSVADYYAGRNEDSFFNFISKDSGRVIPFFLPKKYSKKTISAEDYMNMMFGDLWADKWEKYGSEYFEDKIEAKTNSANNKLKEIAKNEGLDAILIEGSYEGTPLKDLDHDQLFFANNKILQRTENALSSAYHAAKKDGSNPELVRAVEDLLGKEKSMSFDEMREYLLANPDVWMPSSTRKIGAGKMQPSLGGRNVVGEISWVKSPEGKGDPSISERNPAIQKAAQDYRDGKISQDEFGKIIDENRPIGPITRFFEPATEEEVKNALSTDKKEKVGAKVENGEKVGLRLDIPAYKDKNTWVVSVHEGTDEKTGKIISYTNVARIKNAKFVTNPSVALKIATGDVAKSTIARMIGEWQNIPGKGFEEKGEAAKKIIQDIADNPDWVQIGMNPFRHSYFYDRNQNIGQPVVGAEEVVQVGGLVYAKNPVYAEKTDEQFTVKGTNLQFSEGGRGEARKSQTIPRSEISKAIAAAGINFAKLSESGYKKEAEEEAVKAAVEYLTKLGKGYTKEQAEQAVLPTLDKLFVASAKESVMGAIKIATIPEEIMARISMGSVSLDEVREMGLNAIKNKTVDPEAISLAFANGNSRPLSATEVSAMVAYKVGLQDRYNSALSQLAKEKEKNVKDNEKIATLENTVLDLEIKLENYYIAARKSGYEMGLAFRTRQMLLDKDYDLVSVKERYRAKYGPIPPDVQTLFASLDKEKKELQEKIDNLEREKKEFEEYKAMANIAANTAAETTKKKTYGSTIGEFISQKLLSKAGKIPGIFSGKKEAPSGQASIGGRTMDQSDGEYVWMSAVEITSTELQKIKEPTKEQIQKAIDKGTQYLQGTKWYSKLSQADKNEATKEFVEFVKANAKPPSINVVVKGKKISIPHNTLREYVQKIQEENPITEDDPAQYRKLMTMVAEAIRNDFAEKLPLETTVEDIRNAITRYGQQTFPSQEQVEVDIRKMKQVGQKMAQLEALLSGNRPLKTGYQRDPQSPEARELVRDINALMKELELTPYEQAEFLKTSLDRIKTTLRNRIEDLKRQKKELEETGKRTVRSPRQTIYDDEANLLKKEIEALQEDIDALDKAGNMAKAEKQLDKVIAGLVNSIKEYERRIAEKDFSNFTQASTRFENLPKTPEYKKLQAERDALKKQLAALKKGPEKTPEEKRLEELEKTYDSLLDGTYQGRSAPVQYNDPAIKTLRDKIAALKKQLGFAKTPEEIKIEKLRKQLSDLLTGTSRTRGTPAPDSPQAKALKQQISDLKDLMGITQMEKIKAVEKQKESALKKVQERIDKLISTGSDVVNGPAVQSAYIDALNQQIKDKNKIVQDLLDQLGLAAKKKLESDKKRLATLIKNKEEKIAKGEFKKVPKQKTFDDELRELYRKKMDVDERYEEAFMRAELAKRTKFRKIIDALSDAIDLPKGLVGSVDMSAPLRQGLWEVINNPIAAIKGFVFMHQVALNLSNEKGEEVYQRWYNSVKESPLYYEMKKAGLYLAEPNARMRAGEELFANKLIHFVPFVERPIGIKGKRYSLHLYTRSERAFNTFLNYMRVAAFAEVSQAWQELPIPITPEQNPEEYKALADIINISTARPSLGDFESAATVFNKFLFSIRLMASNFLYVFLPFRAMNMPPAARKIALQRWAKGFAAMTALTGLFFLWLDNDDDDETFIELDPRGKFLRVQLSKNISIDFTRGVSQYIALVAKIITGEYKESKTGEIKQIGETKMDPSYSEVFGDFISGKASPSFRFAMEYKLSKPDPNDPTVSMTPYGDRYDVINSLGGLAYPLMLRDAKELIKNGQILQAAGLVPMAFYGMSVYVKEEKQGTLSQRVKKVLGGDDAERNLQLKKFDINFNKGNIAEAKKILEKEVEIMLDKIEKTGRSRDAILDGYSLKDRLKAQYVVDATKKYLEDPIKDEFGLKEKGIRGMFFAQYFGVPLPEISANLPEGIRKRALEARQEQYDTINKISKEDQDKTIAAYEREIKNYELVVEKIESLGLNKGMVNFAAITPDWIAEFKYFKQKGKSSSIK